MSDGLFVTLASVFSYLKANVESRCIVEGEEILNAKHIISLGTTAETNVSVDILALCLQTSAIKSTPHEINGKLHFLENKIEISKFLCSCKAGLSGTCKHVAAVLLMCTRSNISALEKLSSTDVKCYWNNKKTTVEEEYGAKPILETACFKSRVVEKTSLNLEQQQHCFRLLTSVCKESSISLHLKGRSTAVSHLVHKKHFTSADIATIIDCAASSQYLASLEINILEFHIKSCCEQVSKEIFDLKAFEEAVNSSQRIDIWHQERQFRITGSRCYSLFTFSKENWETKATKYFWPKSFTNKYIQHGFKYEDEALEIYKSVNSYDVIKMGLIICKQYPWMAYSPDGIVMKGGSPTRLVEIKCPYEGLVNDAINFIHTCSFLEVSINSGVTLKRKHAYYGQVQLGMAILNLKMCDFVIYSPKSKTFLNIVVPFDEDFTTKMICNISEKYFKYMLHVICQKRGM